MTSSNSCNESIDLNEADNWSSDETEDDDYSYYSSGNITPADSLKNKEIDDIVQTIKDCKLRMDVLLDDITVNWSEFNKNNSLEYIKTLSDSEKIFTKLQEFANKYSCEFKNISQHMSERKNILYEKYNLDNKKDNNQPSTSYSEPCGYCDKLPQVPPSPDDLRHFKVEKIRCNKTVLNLNDTDIEYDYTDMDDMDISDTQLIDTYNELEVNKIIDIEQKPIIHHKDSEVNNNLNLVCIDNIAVQIKREIIAEEELKTQRLENQQSDIRIKQEILSQNLENPEINSTVENVEVSNVSTDNNECTKRMKELTSKLTDRLNKESVKNKEKPKDYARENILDKNYNQEKNTDKNNQMSNTKCNSDSINTTVEKINESHNKVEVSQVETNKKDVVDNKKCDKNSKNKIKDSEKKTLDKNIQVDVPVSKEKIKENVKKKPDCDLQEEKVKENLKKKTDCDLQEEKIKENAKKKSDCDLKPETNKNKITSIDKTSSNTQVNITKEKIKEYTKKKPNSDLQEEKVTENPKKKSDCEFQEEKMKESARLDKNKSESTSSIKSTEKSSKNKNMEVESKKLTPKKLFDKNVSSSSKDTKKLNESKISRQNSYERNEKVQEKESNNKKIDKNKIDRRSSEEKSHHKKDLKRNEKPPTPRKNDNQPKQLSNQTKDLSKSNTEPKVIRRLSIEDYRRRVSQTDENNSQTEHRDNKVNKAESNRRSSKDDYKSCSSNTHSDSNEDKNKNVKQQKSEEKREKIKSPKRPSTEDNRNINKTEECKEIDKKHKNEQKKKDTHQNAPNEMKEQKKKDTNQEKNISNVQNEIKEVKKKDTHQEKNVSNVQNEKDVKRFKKVQAIPKPNLQDKQNETKSKPIINNQEQEDQEKCNKLKKQTEDNPSDLQRNNNDQNVINDNIENIDPSSTSNLNQIIKQKNDQISEVKLTNHKNEVKVLKYINGIPEKVQKFLTECAKYDEEMNPKLLPSTNQNETESNISSLLKETSNEIKNDLNTNKSPKNNFENDKQTETNPTNKPLSKDIKKNNSTTPSIAIKTEPNTETSKGKTNSPVINKVKIKIEPVDPKTPEPIPEKPKVTSKDRLEVPHRSIKTERPDDIDNLSSISGETQILENQTSFNVLHEDSNHASSTATIPYVYKEEKQENSDHLIGKMYERQRILEDFEEDLGTTEVNTSSDRILKNIKQEKIDNFEKETQINTEVNNPPQDSSLIILSDSEQNSSECEDAYISLICDSSCSDSDISESSDVIEEKLHFDNNGRIDNVTLSELLSTKHLEPTTVVNWEETYKEKYGIRESYVYLGQRVEYEDWRRDYENMIKNNEKDIIDSEEIEINRLTNLKNLDNPSKKYDKEKSVNKNKSYKKPEKNITLSTDESFDDSLTEIGDNDDDFSFLPSFSENNHEAEKQPELSSIFVDDIPEVDIFNISSDLNDPTNKIDDDEKSIKKRKKSTEKNETIKEISSDSEEPQKKRSKWRNDPLLNQKLGSSDSDETYFSTDENAENENKIKKRKKRRVSNAESTKTSKSASTPSIFSSDSSDSDIEIISFERNIDPTNKFKRRNIKPLLNDECLQEATKQANKEEENRKLRLTQKQLTLDLICSQPETQEEGGIVLDVDENAKPLIKVNKTLAENLKPHQVEGIKFMWSICFESVKRIQEDTGCGCILAHCMGLGKTRQVVVLTHTLLTHKILNMKKILIVCPLSTVSNWKNEFKITLNSIRNNNLRTFDVRANFNNQKKFQTIKLWHEMGGVLILGYDTFQALVNNKKNKTEQQSKLLHEALISPGPQLIVCDEGHMLKNGKTIRFKSLSKIDTKRRIILTGTPLQNNLKEYYHMVNFVKPNLLGTESEYTNRFVNPILNGQYEDSNPEDIDLMRKRAHVLHKKLETTVQRFESSELEKYMPLKLDYVVSLELSDLQIQLYKRYLEVVSQNDVNINNKKKSLFSNYHTLQYIWTHPAMMKMKIEKQNDKKQKLKTYDEDYIIELDPDNIDQKDVSWFTDICPSDIMNNIHYGPKMEVLFTIIKECKKLGDKLLVFASSLIELDLIEHFLRLEGGWVKNVDYFRMDGTVEPETRSRQCDAFNNPRNTVVKLFLISHKVGGLGLNLFAANRIVLMDVNWNPTYDDQSVYRSFRFGQKKNCVVYRLVSMGTMEEVVHSRAITKLAISARVVDEQQISRHFKSNDLQKMYHLDCDYKPRSITERPQDSILTSLIIHHSTLNRYCKHKALLQTLPHEELNEEEQNEAWKEFNREIEIENEKLKAKNNPMFTKTILPTTQTFANLRNYSNQNEQNTSLYTNYGYPYPCYNNQNDTNYNQFITPNIQTSMLHQNMAITNFQNLPSVYPQSNSYLQRSFENCLSDFMPTENNIYQTNYNTTYQSSIPNIYNQNQSHTTNNQISNYAPQHSNNPSTSNQISNYTPQNSNIPSTSNQFTNIPVNNMRTYSKNRNPNTRPTTNNPVKRQQKYQNKLETRNIIQINTAASYLNMSKNNESTHSNNIITISTENKEKTSTNTISSNSNSSNQVSSSSVDTDSSSDKASKNEPSTSSAPVQVLTTQNLSNNSNNIACCSKAVSPILHASSNTDNSNKNINSLNCSKQNISTSNEIENDNKNETTSTTVNNNETTSTTLNKNETITTINKNEIITSDKKTDVSKSENIKPTLNSDKKETDIVKSSNDDCIVINSSQELNKSLTTKKYNSPKSNMKRWRFPNYSPYNYHRESGYDRMYDREYERYGPYNPQHRYLNNNYYKNEYHHDLYNYTRRRQYFK